jgi:hypothetical protein
MSQFIPADSRRPADWIMNLRASLNLLEVFRDHQDSIYSRNSSEAVQDAGG